MADRMHLWDGVRYGVLDMQRLERMFSQSLERMSMDICAFIWPGTSPWLACEQQTEQCRQTNPAGARCYG